MKMLETTRCREPFDLFVTNPQNRLSFNQRHCEFCSEFLGRTDNAFRALYGDTLLDRSIFKTKHFRVFPSIGQIVEGYLLVAPVEHYDAFCEVPKSLLLELTELCSWTRQALASYYGDCVLFEHGARFGDSGGCGIYHAHLHAVPLPESMSLLTSLRRRFLSRRISGFSELKEQTSEMRGYVLYVDQSSEYHVFDTADLPSQYMRSLLAQTVGANVWDWRSAGREPRLVATLNRLSGCFGGVSTVAQEGHE